MEREIANVAAASAMRGFRYMTFPPIVFDTPLVRLELSVPECPAPEAVAPQPPPPAIPSATASAATSAAIVAPPGPTVPPPAAALDRRDAGGNARIPAERRFALLTDVSAEIRRQTRR